VFIEWENRVPAGQNGLSVWAIGGIRGPRAPGRLVLLGC
jgi:hypothetical protein